MNIGILGISYCGSTLLCYLLGYNDQIFSVGESHWLLDVTSKISPGTRHDSCVICREKEDKKCEFYTDEFKASLTWDNMMSKISERAKLLYNKDICLYSDKHESNYIRMLKHNKLDKAIILFKRPQGWVYSFIRHDTNIYKNLTRRQLLLMGINTYNNFYKGTIRFCKEQKLTPIFLFYEDLAAHTEDTLKRLCKEFNVEYQSKMLKYWENKNFHQIGGNGSPKVSMFEKDKFKQLYQGESKESKWYRKIRKKIVLDERWKTELNPQEIETIQKHQCMDLFATLKERKI